MLIDNTDGELMATLAWAWKQDDESELRKLTERLVYLDQYATDMADACGCTDTKDGGLMVDPSCKLCGGTGSVNRRTDKRNCVVFLTAARDLGDHGFGIAWWFRKQRDPKPGTCRCQYGGRPNDQGCECYRFFMNGGLVRHSDSGSWGVHT
jgi:hypothetical protein